MKNKMFVFMIAGRLIEIEKKLWHEIDTVDYVSKKNYLHLC